MQVSAENPMVGIDGRSSLLYNLGTALKASPKYFASPARHGNLIGMRLSILTSSNLILNSIIDFLESESKVEGSTRKVHISALWGVLIDGLTPIWPARLSLGGIPLGDVWPCDVLKATAVNEGDDLVPFHKLTGWTTYSLVEPIERVLNWTFEGLEDMTGLPEYRNGRVVSA